METNQSLGRTWNVSIGTRFNSLPKTYFDVLQCFRWGSEPGGERQGGEQLPDPPIRGGGGADVQHCVFYLNEISSQGGSRSQSQIQGGAPPSSPPPPPAGGGGGGSAKTLMYWPYFSRIKTPEIHYNITPCDRWFAKVTAAIESFCITLRYLTFSPRGDYRKGNVTHEDRTFLQWARWSYNVMQNIYHPDFQEAGAIIN